jgi:capsular polysaccharide export protein
MTTCGDFDALSKQRVLLLQGPVGPFFSRLAADLRRAGASVYKINFNAGDWIFYPKNAINFRGTTDELPDFLDTVLHENKIELILLFGDCRPIHQIARQVATRRGVNIGVFEEGYIRPNYVTFERNGVNAHSSIPRDPEYYQKRPLSPTPIHNELPNGYWHMVLWGMLYFLVGSMGSSFFRHYRHHRPMNVFECLFWVRSSYRKQWYRFRQRKIMKLLTGALSGEFFLVPLQVHNDSQVRLHSACGDVSVFISEVISSFAAHSPKNTTLVFKHHPMDRGYTHYGKYIAEVAQKHGVLERCIYVHDLHMPTLLTHTRGVVVINSVTGLQALRKGVAVKVVGDAIYDIKGLCFQGSLDQFWRKSCHVTPSRHLLQQFLNYLILRTQINTNFYCVKDDAETATGIQLPQTQPDLAPKPKFEYNYRMDFSNRHVRPIRVHYQAFIQKRSHNVRGLSPESSNTQHSRTL